MKDFKPTIILTVILILGFILRIYGINWDGSCCLHPDERAIVMYTLPLAWPSSFAEFLSPQSPLNPHFFAYGNLPLYILKIVSNGVGLIAPQYTMYTHINIVGRFISVMADLGTLVMLYFIGKQLKSKTLGLLAAGLYAISWFPIQNAHYYTVDIPLTFFVTTTLYLLLRFYSHPSKKLAGVIGVTTGLALVTKISAIVLISAFAAAISLDFLLIILRQPHRPHIYLLHLPHFVKRLVTEGILMVLTTLTTFVILQPYAVIDHTEFIKQNLAQAQMTRDAYTFPYTLQYVGKIPYLYELKNIFLFGLGPLVGVVAIAGFFFTAIEAYKKSRSEKSTEEPILLVFFIVYFLIVGHFAIGFMRYMLPLYPLLILFASLFLTHLFDFNRLTQFLLVFFFGAFIWTLSFLTIYAAPNTRIQATAWIQQHIPAGSTLAVEHWDDQLPLQGAQNYQFVTLPLYNLPDDEVKWQSINTSLEQTDYIIIASNRLYIPLQKLTDCTKYRQCYPLTAQYYEKLFSGENVISNEMRDRLGISPQILRRNDTTETRFTKVAEFAAYPTIPLLNIPIDDQGADESFTVYDHPQIMIYKKQ